MHVDIGATLSEFRLPVDASKAREMALALGADEWADLDPSQLEGRAVVPTFTAASGHWQDRRELLTGPLGLDLTRMLHGEQRWHYQRFPRVGETLDGVTMLSSVTEREGRRGGDMRFITMRTTYTSEGDRVLDEDMVLIETQPLPDTSERAGRQAAAAGPSSPSTDEGEPLGEPWEFGPVSRTDIVRYAGASGDFTRFHHDEPYARELGHAEVFTMGMLQGGLVGVFLSRLVPTERIEHFSVRFRDRLWPGERLRISGSTLSPGQHRLEARADDGRVIVSGEAQQRA